MEVVSCAVHIYAKGIMTKRPDKQRKHKDLVILQCKIIKSKSENSSKINKTVVSGPFAVLSKGKSKINDL